MERSDIPIFHRENSGKDGCEKGALQTFAFTLLSAAENFTCRCRAYTERACSTLVVADPLICSSKIGSSFHLSRTLV